MRNPLVSVAIPVFNSKNLINICLKSVLKTKYSNFEIILVDDYSLDGTYEILVKKYSRNPKIKILRNEKNFGPSKTRNKGIKAAKGKYVAFVETDMEVDPNWLSSLVKALEKDKSLGAVQSKVLDINRRDFIHSTGVFYNPHTFWVWSFATAQPKDFKTEQREVGIGSVGSLVRKDVLDKLGGFDEKIVHNIDDTELSWRIWLLGFRCITIPESITYHWTAKPTSVREKALPSLSSEFHFHKTFRIFLKNYEWKNIVRYTPWLFFAFSLRILKNLYAGNTKPLKGFLKTVVWFVRNLKDSFKERSKIQKLRKRSDKEMFDILAVKGSFSNFYSFYTKRNVERIRRVFEHRGTKIEICLRCGGVLLDDSNTKYAICSHCTLKVLLP